MASSASQTTKQMASAALSAFLSERHAQRPARDASRALRRKQQRERKKRANSHHDHDADTAAASDSEHASASASKSKPRSGTKNDGLTHKIKKAPMSKEEREIRQRILKMRENKRKGIPIIPQKKSADTDTSDDDF
ncbi:hypothetical protein TWF696_002285 [Orbilia brochopaga]|uniref:Uncharacterized protein n=1 Tax=Orbilia brochopaga TaxID=3140254 RepID=A0AAV9U3V0_9PEZI